MARQRFPVVLSAASGTGKTTLAHMLLAADSDLKLSVSYTTRAPRGEEEDGVAYHFVSREDFEARIAQDEFIEWAEVHGNYYGSSAAWTAAELYRGADILFDIDVQGGKQIKERFPEAALIFIVPPSMEVLESRLRGRGTDADDVIKRRMDAARGEILEGLETYDYVITNNHLDRALFDLTSIVRAHRLRGLDRNKVRAKLGFDLA